MVFTDTAECNCIRQALIFQKNLPPQSSGSNTEVAGLNSCL